MTDWNELKPEPVSPTAGGGGRGAWNVTPLSVLYILVQLQAKNGEFQLSRTNVENLFSYTGKSALHGFRHSLLNQIKKYGDWCKIGSRGGNSKSTDPDVKIVFKANGALPTPASFCRSWNLTLKDALTEMGLGSLVDDMEKVKAQVQAEPASEPEPEPEDDPEPEPVQADLEGKPTKSPPAKSKGGKKKGKGK